MTTVSQRSTHIATTRRATAWQRWRYRHRHAFEAWIILIPVLVYYTMFSIVPVMLNLSLSFTRWNGISGLPQWVGTANYLQYLRGDYPLIIFKKLFEK